jgi:hypothetical protein
MLRKEKLAAIATRGKNEGWLDDREVAALSEVSDKEKVELKVLARLYQLSDTSPEYLQVRTITGGDSREEIAAKLADIYYKKHLTDEIMTRFVAPSTTKGKILATSAKKSRDAFATFLSS